jgi:hypothetical protein
MILYQQVVDSYTETRVQISGQTLPTQIIALKFLAAIPALRGYELQYHVLQSLGTFG